MQVPIEPIETWETNQVSGKSDFILNISWNTKMQWTKTYFLEH